MKSGTLLIVAVMMTAGCVSTKEEIPFRAGVASGVINPDIGAYIAGDKQNRTFTGVHDSLFVKAVVVSHGAEHIALVTVDCIGLLYPEVLRIRERAHQLCRFPKERIIVSSTHTHSGPDVVGIWGPDFQHSGVDSAYMDLLVEAAAEQIRSAYENRQQAKLSVAETTFGEPWVRNICNEEIDRSVTVLRIADQNDESIVTLTNFACHPTFLDANFSEVSADYLNGYYKVLRQLTGGEAMFLQGAIGGWVQPEDGPGSFDKAFNRGSELAHAVFAALSNPEPLNGSGIRLDQTQVRFPVENDGWKQLAAIGTITRDISDSVTTELTWFSIGDAQFATHPGETAPFYGLETKKLMTSRPKFVLGLGNDALGYILKPTFFEDPGIPHAEYLTSMSVGKQTAPIMMENLRAIMKPAENDSGHLQEAP